MKPSEALRIHGPAIRRIVERHRARNPRVFGSTARGQDREGSDLDILVDPMPGMTLLDLGAIQGELQDLMPDLPIDVHVGPAPERFMLDGLRPVA